MIQWALEVTNLTEYRDREVSRLSGGQRQRVWIAMALCQGTKTLFLDEPTTYLDIRYQIEILQLVKKLNQEFGITIIMVLHDINQAIAYSENVIGMKDEKSIKNSLDCAWISLSGTWYDRNCTSYPANCSVLHGNAVLLCQEFKETA